MGFEDVEARVNHVTVIVAVKFVDFNIWMTDQFQHSPEISILLVTSIKFQIAVTAYDDVRRCVLADMVKRSPLVDCAR